MILTVLATLLLLLPAAFGGKLSRLAEVEIAGRHWLLLGLLLQVVAIGLGSRVPREVAAGLHISSYLVLGAVIWANRALPGVPLIGLGGLGNGLTIAVNGGTLPASAEAMAVAGLRTEGDGFSNSAPLAEPRLWFLGDVFAIPAPIPLANVFSVGDVLILAGVALASARICGPARSGSGSRS
ncbi:hypothetical protein Kisp01_10340 [Kineosporia sp. NBRC 101677]|uniref:DUF5317 family protein n=1 Tax=Kineosporia sp. NBRC 101677 TaxID=3032197 RepID=UPI0024A46B38|nr:DUF5317 family protein [Kineosporia sp. NBRC 101677]GLY14018.1 hypothetical protein Kisp01_10340 [Kineosporia sp. NBRC 101677]